MKAVLLGVVVALSAASGYGQYQGPPMVPVPPQAPVQVNQQVVAPGGPQGGYIPPGLPIQEWRDGLRESFVHSDTHEVRPIREWEHYYQQQPQVYNQQYVYPQQYGYGQGYYQPQQQWYYQPNTACYQRPCQQQYYCQPQCQTYCPQYYRPSCWQNWFGW